MKPMPVISGVAVLEAGIDLGDIDGEEHRHAGAHRNQGEGTHTGNLPLALALQPDKDSEKHRQEQFEHGAREVDFRGVDFFDKIAQYVLHITANLLIFRASEPFRTDFCWDK